jgi:hypothetical protein
MHAVSSADNSAVTFSQICPVRPVTNPDLEFRSYVHATCYIVTWYNKTVKNIFLPLHPFFSGNARLLVLGTSLPHRGTYPLPKLGVYEGKEPCSKQSYRKHTINYKSNIRTLTEWRREILPAFSFLKF